MTYDSEGRHRQSIRLQGYDYSQNGAYFLTICTQNRECLFGEIVNGEMRLKEFGGIVNVQWLQTAAVRPYVTLDEFVVIPNHFHGILFITKPNDDPKKLAGGDIVGAQRAAPLHTHVAPGSLGAIVRGFKSAVTKRINELRDTPGAPVWQRNYYEHVIRNETSHNDIRSYIQANPARWAEDRENPANTGR